MTQFLKIIGFSLIVIALFATYSNLGIPQIKPAPPPSQEAVDLSSMDMDSFIALGENLFKVKGACTLCHNEVGGRAPMLENISETIPSRLADASYQGTATNIAEYIIESMVEPSIYVVRGFGKLGSNDRESPMPDVRAGSIGFSEAETLAVVAFLQDSNGLEVTVTVPSNLEESDASSETGQAGTERAKYTSGEDIVAQLGCGACHKVAQFDGALGPDLSHIGRTRDVNHLRRSILNPNAEITEGYLPIMPPVYGDQLYASELEMLVNYMVNLK